VLGGRFDVYGITPSVHEHLRNKKGVYSRVIAALESARKYDMDISIAFTPTAFNVTEISGLHAYLEQLSYNGKIEMRVQPLMPLGRGNKNAEEIEPTQAQYRILVNTINTLNQLGKKVHIEWGDPIDHLLRYPEHKSLPVYYVSIRSNGDIVASPYLPLVVGNFRNHSLEEYWKAGLCKIWSKKIPCYMASFVQSIADMGTVQDVFPKAFFEDIRLDMIENDLDDLSYIETYQI
jgi:MoaA/NifB/PqqE/SkfB family radical SAM enzyme